MDHCCERSPVGLTKVPAEPDWRKFNLDEQADKSASSLGTKNTNHVMWSETIHYPLFCLKKILTSHFNETIHQCDNHNLDKSHYERTFNYILILPVWLLDLCNTKTQHRWSNSKCSYPPTSVNQASTFLLWMNNAFIWQIRGCQLVAWELCLRVGFKRSTVKFPVNDLSYAFLLRKRGPSTPGCVDVVAWCDFRYDERLLWAWLSNENL